jgi:filamentous hemagglutinin
LHTVKGASQAITLEVPAAQSAKGIRLPGTSSAQQAGRRVDDVAPATQIVDNGTQPVVVGEGAGLSATVRPQAVTEGVGANSAGPQVIVGREAVNLAEFKRLNVLDADVARYRPGEAGAAAELQSYLGGSLKRSPAGTSGDFVFSSGPNAGKTVDFMLTPDSFKQAAKINQFFEKNMSGFSKQLDLHLQKADLVPMDTRFLTERNNQLLSDLVKNLPSAQQQKIILTR